MTRTRSAGQRTPPSDSSGPDGKNIDTTEVASGGSSERTPSPAAVTADKSRRNPPRSSRGCKTVGRDYTDLVKSCTAPARQKPSEPEAGGSSAKTVPLAPPPPPPPALTLRTVVVDGVIKEARCSPFVPPKTKLTLRRTKHGWGVTSRAARSSASAAPITAAAIPPEPAQASDVAMPDVDDEELTQRLKLLYSRNKSSSSRGNQSSEEEASVTQDGPVKSSAMDSAKRVGETEDGTDDSARESALNGGAVAEASENGAREENPSVNVDSSSLSERLRNSKEDSGDNCGKTIKREPKISVKSEFGFSMMCADAPHLGLEQRCDDTHWDNAAPLSRPASQTARHSPMLASLLEGTQSAAESDKLAPPAASSSKSCELLKHLLSNSAGAATKEQANMTEGANTFQRLKFHTHEPQHYGGCSREPTDDFKFLESPAKAPSPLDPKCKQTPSPVSTPLTARTNPAGTLWNFLNDPKVGIPDVLLIPVSRLKLLFSQPLIELANLTTFTTEAVKYIGWHPAFRSVDIVKVSRDRLYRLLKDPRNEVKQLLTDPRARLFPCRRSASWLGSRPPGMVPLSAAGSHVGSAVPTSATTSLLRQKLMTRGGLPPPDYAAHCKAGFAPAVTGFTCCEAGGGGGVATAGVPVAIRPLLPVLTPLSQAVPQADAHRNSLFSLLKQPLGKQAFLTDEVTIRAIPTQEAAPQPPPKRSLPDLIPQGVKRRAPPELRPLQVAVGPRLEADMPPCPDDSDGEDGAALIAADFVQTCMEEPSDGAEQRELSGRSEMTVARSEQVALSANVPIGVLRSDMTNAVSNELSCDGDDNGVREPLQMGSFSVMEMRNSDDIKIGTNGAVSVEDTAQKGRNLSPHDASYTGSASENEPKNAEVPSQDNPDLKSADAQMPKLCGEDGKCSVWPERSASSCINEGARNESVYGSSILHAALSLKPASAAPSIGVDGAASSDVEQRPVGELGVSVSVDCASEARTGITASATSYSSAAAVSGGDASAAGSSAPTSTPNQIPPSGVATTRESSGMTPAAATSTVQSSESAKLASSTPLGGGDVVTDDVESGDVESGDEEGRLVINEDTDATADTPCAEEDAPATLPGRGSANDDVSSEKRLGGGTDRSSSVDVSGAMTAGTAEGMAPVVEPQRNGHTDSLDDQPEHGKASHTQVQSTANAPQKVVEDALQACAPESVAKLSHSRPADVTHVSPSLAEGGDNVSVSPAEHEEKASNNGAQRGENLSQTEAEGTPPARRKSHAAQLAHTAVESTVSAQASPAALENGGASPTRTRPAQAAPPASVAPSAPQPDNVTGRKRSSESAAEQGPARKAARVQPEPERATPLTLNHTDHRTVEMIESTLHKLRREVKAIDLLSRRKEREWDSLLRLRKAKEETFQRLRRKREVLLLQQANSSTAEARALAAAAAAAPGSPATAAAVAQLAQKHRTAAAAALLAQQTSLTSAGRQQRPYTAASAAAAAAAAQMGMGPQGPTISVRHLIESHRSGATAGVAPTDPLLRRREPTGPNDPQYRDVLANLAKLSKQVSAPSAEVTIHQVGTPAASPSGAVAAGGGSGTGGLSDQATSQPQSSLARLLMESKMKQVEPNVLNEILKRQPATAGSRLSAALLQSPQTRLPAPASRPPQSQPQQQQQQPQQQQQQQQQRAADDNVPICQGCRARGAQFVCAGCGSQWYCSRECQVEAWDKHADECSG